MSGDIPFSIFNISKITSFSPSSYTTRCLLDDPDLEVKITKYLYQFFKLELLWVINFCFMKTLPWSNWVDLLANNECMVNCKKTDFACTSTAHSSYTKHWKHTLQRFFLFLLTAYPCTEQLTSPKRDSESSHLVGKFWVYEIVNLISELFIWLRELGKMHEYY